MTEYPAQLKLSPVSNPVNASVLLPGSKSITNRALVIAAFADGTSVLHSPLHSEDTIYMADALRALGVDIKKYNPDEEHLINWDKLQKDDFIVKGIDGKFTSPETNTIFIGNSGTTIRFLTAAACFMPDGAEVVLDGIARMRERPILDLLGALISLGANVESVKGHGCPPVRVCGGGLIGGECRLKGDVSSQFLTALLISAPYADKDVDITIIEELISKPYIDITKAVMESFGVKFQNDDYKKLRIEAGQRYKAIEYTIEADASNASYFLAAAAVTGGSVRLTNLGANSIQGDIKFIDILEQMGCIVERDDQLIITAPKQLKSIEANLEAIPDTAQTLAVVAAFADGPSHITGLSSLRVKETDRISAIANELRKLGIKVDEGKEDWTIYPIKDHPTQEVTIDTYQDHRMAMSFAVAGLKIPAIVINDPGCVAKTFPDFWERWNSAFY